ncbi:MAG: tetratricopeptide repeat protein, partial [Gemmatimonadota bacterium]
WGVVATGWYLLGDRLQPEPLETAAETRSSIAVLPFENLSGEQVNEPFTNGIHDDILVHLSKISSLKVISRFSVMEYRGTARNVRRIAEELDVATVLEGGVQRAGDRVRINVQLIDAQSDEHIWAETYDRDLTAENIFAVQTDIARRIAATLEATLTADEMEQIEARPTGNLEAYEYYLRGGEIFRALGSDNFQMAVQMYERAVELDPNFALAYAALSWAHIRIHFFQGLPGALASARTALDEALRLGPDLSETQMAEGYYHYWGSLDYDKALERFRAVEAQQPNNSDVLMAIGGILRRQGKWEEAVAYIGRAVELDPRSEVMVSILARTYENARRWGEAERYTNRAIALNPYNPDRYKRMAELYLESQGSTARARDVLQEASLGIDVAWVLLESGTLVRIFGEEYAAALDRLSLSAPAIDTVDYFLAKAELSARRGQSGPARAYYDSVRVILEARVQEEPAALGLLGYELSLAYAGLGRAEDAIQVARAAVDMFPLSKDAWRGANLLSNLAEVYVRVGEYDAAIEQLELLLSIPSPLSANLLRVDPLWDPLRDDPRFQKLLEDYQ